MNDRDRPRVAARWASSSWTAVLPSLALCVGAQILAACGPAGQADSSDAEGDSGINTTESYLTDEERLLLFDVERSDYLLGRALAAFHEALQTANAPLLEEQLTADFRASVPALDDNLTPGTTPVNYGKLESTREVDRAGFQAWAEALADRFDAIEAVRFARYQNSAEIIEGVEAVAESLGSFRIAGTSAGGPLELTGSFTLRHKGFARLAEDANVEDVEDVQRSDWITGLELSDTIFVGAPAPLFEEVTERCGVELEHLYDNWRDREKHGVLIFTGGVQLGDINDDGHLDLFVTEILKSDLYFGNGDGTFRDSGWHPPSPMERDSEGRTRVLEPYAAIFDATGNGRPDIYYGGQIFTWSWKRKEIVGVKMPELLPNADPSLCDYDRDGLVDLYFINSGRMAREEDRRQKVWFDDDRVNGRANQLFRNLGGGRFEDVTESANASPGFGRTFATTWFYANDDEWPDLFGANEFGRNVFLVNEGDGTFREVDDVDDVFGGFSMGVTSGDMDGDGRADLYVSNMYSKAGQRVYHHLDLEIYPESAQRMFNASVTGNRLYRSLGDLEFENTSAYAGGYAVGWGFSGAMFDVDLDGWLDLYAPCGYISIDATKPDG